MEKIVLSLIVEFSPRHIPLLELVRRGRRVGGGEKGSKGDPPKSSVLYIYKLPM